MKKRVFICLGILMSVSCVYAAYFSFTPYVVKQPNGTVINCFVSGDEYFNWLHDKEGYTIIQAPDGYFYYGIASDGLVRPSSYKVNEVRPSDVGLRAWAKISKAEYLHRRAIYQYNPQPSIRAPHTGVLNNIVVYIRFSDDTEFTNTRQSFDDKFNLMPGISLKSYYSDVSYNQLTVSSTHYPVCAMTTNLSYQDSHPRSYFEPYNATTNPNGYNGDTEQTFREHTLLRDAIDWININSPVPTSLNIDGDNDGNVDNVCFNVRGNNGAWASLLWAHSWALYSYNVMINGKRVWGYTFQPETQIDVQTLCHEMFHSIGAPDLYHYSYDGLQPVQYWDLMEQGFGHMGAYMKWKYANNTWIGSIPEITSSGTYTLNQLSSSTNNCYKIASPNSTSEYFVVEYRKATGTFESNLPGSGLLVYRINPALNGNASGPPDEVYIYRIYGTTTVNGSPNNAFFSLESGRTSINDATNPSCFLGNGNPGGLDISNITSAGSTISFTISINGIGTPTNFTATPVSTSQINLQWLKNGNSDNVMLAWSATPTFGTPVNGATYVSGNTIPGGGTVLFSGAGTTFNHTGLSPSTKYYYKLWSVTSGNNYSNGISQNATTLCTSSSLPYSQSFLSEVFPQCWSTQFSGTGAVDSWGLSNTTFAGGSAFEMKSTFQNVISGITRLVTLPINTTGMTVLNLSFKHMLDDYGPGATLRIQSSTNGSTWTNEGWSLATYSDSNVGPATISTTITHNLNSPNTFISFTIEGNLFQYDYWYIDDVSISGSSTYAPTVSTTTATAITQISATSGGTVTAAGASDVTARGVCWSTSASPTIAGNHTTDGSGLGGFVSLITGLSPSTTYHVRAYATNSSATSYGNDLPFTTLCGAINSFPWSEGFENGGVIPNCWTQERVAGSGIDWTFITGNGSNNPVSAHAGSYNACLKDASSTDNKTKLITPSINLAVLIAPQLKFWHTQAAWGGDQDKLIVYYRTSSTGAWTSLATYTTSITSWTQETISLPGSSATYYIAFEGNAKYGFGVCLDDVSVVGTSPSLTVTPFNQPVSAVAGSTSFSVFSNSTWTAASNQSWCIVTPAGSGNGTITANYTLNPSGSSRVAEITVTVAGVTPVVATVTQAGSPDKVLTLTAFLEGLYDGNGMMHPAMDENGTHWGATIADKITVELHDAANYPNIIYSDGNILLNTNGSASVTIPGIHNGSYYITIKHRNSIETLSAVPISFLMASIGFSFDAQSKAYGSNLLQTTDGRWVVFGGDANQDGIIDGSDLSIIENLASMAATGYLPEDVNGDGLIDASDLSIVGNNANFAIVAITP